MFEKMSHSRPVRQNFPMIFPFKAIFLWFSYDFPIFRWGIPPAYDQMPKGSQGIPWDPWDEARLATSPQVRHGIGLHQDLTVKSESDGIHQEISFIDGIIYCIYIYHTYVYHIYIIYIWLYIWLYIYGYIYMVIYIWLYIYGYRYIYGYIYGYIYIWLYMCIFYGIFHGRYLEIFGIFITICNFGLIGCLVCTTWT